MLKKSMTPYGAFIRKYRISHYVFLEPFAAKMGMAKNYLLDIEVGNEPMPVDFKDKLLNTIEFDEVSKINLIASIEETLRQQEQERKEVEQMLTDTNGIRTPTVVVQLDEGAVMPSRAHDTDAGFDLYARCDN